MSAPPSPYRLRLLTLADYDAVMALMRQTPGVSIRDADSAEATARYLARNPGLSFVAEQEGTLIGCVMAGHDGRRGYLQHLVVRGPQRRQGVAQALVQACLAALQAEGIRKTHIDVLATNLDGQRWWARRGWRLRDDIRRYSFIRDGGDNA